MNKRIILSLALIAGVAIAVVGGTRAYFTDTAISEGNTFSVGGLTILLGGRNNEGEEVIASEAFFNVSGLIPGGECETAYIEIKNDGDMDMLFRAYARNAQEKTALLDYLNLDITLNPNDYDSVLGGTPYGPTNVPYWNGTLRDLYGMSNALDNLGAAFHDEDPLWPDYVAIYEVEVCLDFNTPDSLQDSTMTADLRIDATQYDGQTPEDVGAGSEAGYRNLVQW